MAGVLVDLSNELKQVLSQTEPDAVVVRDDVVLQLYTSKTIAARLSQDGVLNLVHVEAGLPRGVSLEALAATDIGTGFGGQKKQVVTSEIVDLSDRGDTVLAFHWNGFVSRFAWHPFALEGQDMSK